MADTLTDTDTFFNEIMYSSLNISDYYAMYQGMKVCVSLQSEAIR